MPKDGVSRVVVVAPQSGAVARADRGELIVVTDVEGHQVGDLWAIDAVDHRRWLSCGHTRDRSERLFPAMGEDFRDQLGEPILRLAGDSSPGVHDMLFPACDPEMYAAVGLVGHVNCRDNFLAAAATAGIELPVVPDPVNLFQNSGPSADGRLVIGPALSEPGDEISLLALRDVVVVVTSCAVDYPPLNGGRCTPLLIAVTSVHDGDGSAML
ncbi:MAG TPA: urea carboxylase-associated family protein [Streptosporangiaceae bacterium]|nr:urea carboxylase-associated family protein [Streptosporangiaceae bacterium]